MFRTPTTRIFASAVNLEEISEDHNGGANFSAFLDYHEGGNEQTPAHVAHVAGYPVPLSVEFRRWLGKDGAALSQVDFISFIENNAADIVAPDAATIMELAQNFEQTSTLNFQSKIDRVTGGRRLNYQHEVTAAGAPGQITVPEFMTLYFPVFEGDKNCAFKARLEYRTERGRLTIAYHLQRPHKVYQAALAALRTFIATELELQILTGWASKPTTGFDGAEAFGE